MKIKNILIIGGLIAILITISIINIKEAKENNINKTENITKETYIGTREIGTSRYYGNIENGSRMLHNNVWGQDPTVKSYISYIYYNFDGSFGWEWNRSKIENNNHTYISPIYPEVVVGVIPGDGQSTTDSFPIKVGDIKTLYSEVEYEYVIPPTGNYNLAFDIYFMDPSDPDLKRFNIMIWIEGHLDGSVPDSYVSDGFNEYERHHREPSEEQYWRWYGFILKNQKPVPSKIKINIKKLIEQLPKGSIQDDWVVPGIEFGSEVWRGYGRIQINKYEIDLNNKTI